MQRTQPPSVSSEPTAVTIPAGDASLEGDLRLPLGSSGVVLFAHGSGSTRKSPRNVYVATVLESAGIGSLLFDLLTIRESAARENVFDIPLLAKRLRAAARWVRSDARTAGLPVGYFGASTGAAAALVAAAGDPAVRAVVSRGGRPDLAREALEHVLAPTLLIVGGDDPEVLRLNEGALTRLPCVKDLAIVPGATHLFEEPGTLEQVARDAARWFARYLRAAQPEPEAGHDPRDLRRS